MHFYIITQTPSSQEDFINFWKKLYKDSDNEYFESMKGELTDEKISELFKWKNGRELYGKQPQAIDRYRKYSPLPSSPEDHEGLRQYFETCGTTIWPAFWLHCNHPESFPIFDQHVYRAMKYLKTGEIEEIPSSYTAYSMAYVEEYIPFFNLFREKSNGDGRDWEGVSKQTRAVDKALFSFGKHLLDVKEAEKAEENWKEQGKK